MVTHYAGLRAGWRHRDAEHCLVLSLQAMNGHVKGEEGYDKLSLAIGDEQLCSLARDLSRAAKSRGLEVWPTKPGVIRSGVDRLVSRLTRSRQPVLMLTDRYRGRA
jgi:hypothetical protein